MTTTYEPITPPAARPSPRTPPLDLIATLAHFYCVAGLSPKDAWRSAIADYECFFQGVTLGAL